jgi:hypothetical protein
MTVPADFPREAPIASIPGGQPKLAVRRDIDIGKYVDGLATTEVEERFEVCTDLVEQLVAKCLKNRTTKYAALTEVQILERLLAQLLGTGWGTKAEMRWVVRHTATDLGWAIPESATVLRTMLGFGP